MVGDGIMMMTLLIPIGQSSLSVLYDVLYDVYTILIISVTIGACLYMALSRRIAMAILPSVME